MTFRPLPVMSFLLIPGLALLLWLGSWQWARYQEKMAAAEGLDVSESYSLDIRSADYPLQFAYSTFEGQSVWRSFQPVEACLTNGADTEWCPDALVFVDTGLVQGLEPDASLVQRLSAPDLTQAYYVMQPGQRSMITPADKPEDRHLEALRLNRRSFWNLKASSSSPCAATKRSAGRLRIRSQISRASITCHLNAI